MTTEKIKARRDKKKEEKKQAYEKRYNELASDHAQHREKGLQPQAASDSHTMSEKEAYLQSRNSHESGRSTREGTADGPSDWVDAAARERSGAGR